MGKYGSNQRFDLHGDGFVVTHLGVEVRHLYVHGYDVSSFVDCNSNSDEHSSSCSWGGSFVQGVNGRILLISTVYKVRFQFGKDAFWGDLLFVITVLCICKCLLGYWLDRGFAEEADTRTPRRAVEGSVILL